MTRTQEGKQWHRANNKIIERTSKRVLNDKYKHALELMKQTACEKWKGKQVFLYLLSKESRNKQRKNSYLMRNKLGMVNIESREKIIKLLENPLVFYELN